MDDDLGYTPMTSWKPPYGLYKNPQDGYAVAETKLRWNISASRNVVPGRLKN